MDGSLSRARRFDVAQALCALCFFALTAGGCASWNWNVPRIDPTGERLFVPAAVPTPFGSPAPSGSPTTVVAPGPLASPSAVLAAPEDRIIEPRGIEPRGMEPPATNPRLDVQLKGPQTAEVGSTVRFEVMVTNVGDRAAADLVITDTFDEGLKHLVANSPIERELGTLRPGQSQSIHLSFQVTKPGELCHAIEVTGAGGLKASARSCVTVKAALSQLSPQLSPQLNPQLNPQPRPQPAIEVKKTGPRRLHVGDVAKFAIEIRNTGNVPLTNLRIEDRYDQVIEPTHATEGYAVDDEQLPLDEQGRPSDVLFWRLPRLEPGATHKLEVHCDCLVAAARACNRVTVSCVERPPVAHEACLEILQKLDLPNAPPVLDEAVPDKTPAADAAPMASAAGAAMGAPADLKLSISSFTNPARVGDQVKYQIEVVNPGQTSQKGVALVVTFPAEMRPVQVGTKAPVRYKIAEGRINFEPVAELRAGEPIQYVIPFEMIRAGSVRLEATLSGDSVRQPITQTVTTEIITQ